MENVTLRQLRYFEALVRHGHFGRAAEASAVSQPALSVQIKDLEDSLGHPLFERSSKGIMLTAFGEDFAPRVRGILQAVDELGNMARAAGASLTGRFRIGVIPTIAPYLLPLMIPRLTSDHQDLDLQIRETMTERLLDSLAEGQLDAAILALPTNEPNLTEVTLFEEDLLLVRPRAHEGWPMPTKKDLTDMRVLLLEEGHCFRDHALSFCTMSGIDQRDSLNGSSLSTLVQMVGAGLGVTLIPEMAVAVETRAAPVCVGRFDGVQPKRTVGMVWRKTNPLAPHLEQMADIIRTCGSDLKPLIEHTLD